MGSSMKAQTSNRYVECIDRVVAHLQCALSESAPLPELADLAAVAHLSPFHFHRVYRAIAGETVGRTLVRLRLLRALHLLENQTSSVTDIALQVGYESPQALARAFRENLGATPSELRAQPAALALHKARLARPATAEQAMRAPLEIQVVAVEPFEVVALRDRGSFAELDKAYGRLFAWAADAGVIDALVHLVGLPLNDWRDAGPAGSEFDCCLAFSKEIHPPAPFRLMQLGGGDYARMRNVGSYDGLESATDRLLAWLGNSRFELREAPIHYVYLDDPDEIPEAVLRAEVLVPVRLCRDGEAGVLHTSFIDTGEYRA